MKPAAGHPWKAPIKQRPPEQWTAEQLEAERKYRETERLGILLGTQPETPGARMIAEREADESIKQLKEQNEHNT